MTVWAWVLNLFTATAALRTRLLHSKEALLHTHLALPMTSLACDDIRGVFRPFTIASVTRRRRGEADLFLATAHRFLKR